MPSLLAAALADRQRLNSIMHKLVKIAEIYNVAIIVTNQVQSTPDTFFGDPTKPGGNVIGHASTYRIYLRKAGNDRIAKIIDSPYHHTLMSDLLSMKRALTISTQKFQRKGQQEKKRTIRLEKRKLFSLPLLIFPSLRSNLSSATTYPSFA